MKSNCSENSKHCKFSNQAGNGLSVIFVYLPKYFEHFCTYCQSIFLTSQNITNGNIGSILEYDPPYISLHSPNFKINLPMVMLSKHR